MIVEVLGYVGDVTLGNGDVSYGVSHARIGVDGAKPILLCGADSSFMNWTSNNTPKGELCKRCAQRMRVAGWLMSNVDRYKDRTTSELDTFRLASDCCQALNIHGTKPLWILEYAEKLEQKTTTEE